MPHPLTGPLTAFAARLRFPTLFKLTLALMLVSWLLPDPIPFIDEIVTALATLMLASWRRRDGSAGKGQVIEGESRRE
ncbi:DUF6116 family protein [Arenimonas sp.]|uniref:DUF6116 family protein n=1 Tax=Arenimonas sp. TaxID=1872635 RepID=UPI0035AFF6F8